MSATARWTDEQNDTPLYEVRLQGHLDRRWSNRLQGLSFTFESDGTTILTGQIPDQAALHGLLTQIRDLGVPIVSIRRIDNEERRGPTP